VPPCCVCWAHLGLHFSGSEQGGLCAMPSVPAPLKLTCQLEPQERD
jgi:hypothetical protein